MGNVSAVQCTRCKKWFHKRCMKKEKNSSKMNTAFKCKRCDQIGAAAVDGGAASSVKEVVSKTMDIGGGVMLEKTGKFCYLGDMLNADGGVDSARVGSGWKKFSELTAFLSAKWVPLKIKGKVYESCVRSCMTYGSETWTLKAEHEKRLETTEMRMIRRICGVTLRDRCTNASLRDKIGVEPITDVCRRNRLRWFGHVQRKDDMDWVKQCTTWKVEGRKQGRPRKTWNAAVKYDMKSCICRSRMLWTEIYGEGWINGAKRPT